MGGGLVEMTAEGRRNDRRKEVEMTGEDGLVHETARLSSSIVISSKARNLVPLGSPERFLPGGRNDKEGVGGLAEMTNGDWSK
jgi:hypothetical protein